MANWKEGRPCVDMQYIGIMVGSLLLNKIKRGKQLPIISFYEEAGVLHDITPCYFQLKDLSIETESLMAFVQDSQGKGYKRMSIPRPRVIHNRGYHTLKEDKQKIRSLQKAGIIFFNDWNFYGKLQLDRMLRENPSMVPFLPETEKLNQISLERMMECHQELIIKPNKGSLGKRNMKITRKSAAEWVLDYPNGSSRVHKRFTKGEWPKRLEEILARSSYLVQERIPLAEWNGSPFDIRVSVQRNGTGEWQITGMVGKVAKTGNFVTNVARGGTCYPLGEIIAFFPHLKVEQVYLVVEQLALSAAKQLERHLPYLADLGLDIGITQEGFPMFIECNARDLRYSFEQAGLMCEWKATYTTPISYGKYLLDTLEMRMRDE